MARNKAFRRILIRLKNDQARDVRDALGQVPDEKEEEKSEDEEVVGRLGAEQDALESVSTFCLSEASSLLNALYASLSEDELD